MYVHVCKLNTLVELIDNHRIDAIRTYRKKQAYEYIPM